MQAEKKELVTNELAKSLNRAYDTVKQGPSRNTILTVVAAVGIVLVVGLFWWFWTSSSAVESQRWSSLDEAMFPQQLEEFVEKPDLKGTPQYRVALFKKARMKLAFGLRDLASYSEREKAREQIEESIAIYEELAKTSSLSPQLQQEAIWGQAKGLEALGSSDNVADATKLYQGLVKDYPTSALGKDAKKQLERLDRSSTKKGLADLDRELRGK